MFSTGNWYVSYQLFKMPVGLKVIPSCSVLSLQGDPRIMIDDTEPGNSKLTIMGVLQEDMGSYTCTATNPAGRAQRNVSVIIQREYLRIILLSFFVGVSLLIQCSLICLSPVHAYIKVTDIHRSAPPYGEGYMCSRPLLV